MRFKRFDEPGTDFDKATGKYTLNRNFNLLVNGRPTVANAYVLWLNLPSSADYIGSVVNLYDCPIRTRSSVNLVLAVDDPQSGLITTLRRGEFGLASTPRIETYGGIMQLLAVPSTYSGKCLWHVTYQYMSEFKIYQPQ